MHLFKLIAGLCALVLAWAILFRSGYIYKFNAFMREYVFSDRLVLFSGNRVAMLLLVLGAVSLFSGIENLIQVREIRPQVAAAMLDQAQDDFRKERYMVVIKRCQELLRSDPKLVEAWELLVNSWLALGDRDRARQGVQSISRLRPNHPYLNGPWADLVDTKKP